jgi:quercetin dioxygenase-like cupin family protein
MKRLSFIFAMLFSCAFLVVPALAQTAEAEHKMYRADQLEWKPGPAGLPSGAQMAVLEGDPAEEGLFTVRFRVPAGYRIPPHTHPRVERVTVLSGSFKLGMGREFEETKLETLPTGAFFTMPPGMEHFAAAEEEAVIQLTGEGPWVINYINPADDPRKKSE